MSWQSYVNDILIGSGQIKKGAIFARNGSIYAKSNNLQLLPGELIQIATGFSDQTGFRSGIFVEGKKYLTLKANDESLYGKLGPGGVIIVRTKNVFVLGIYGSPVSNGQASTVVEKFGDYLRESGL